ncbi:universal stress protein [Halolamina sp.]|uniref:universal stress protein n=1 Tax=Halolamina sp. TaxID=1940283 RepID=UPI000677DCF7
MLRKSAIPVLTSRVSAAPLDTSYDEILLPVDGSSQSRRAADHAFDIAARYDARVHTLSIIDESHVTSQPLLAALETESAAALDAAERRGTEAGVETRTSVWKGTPDRCIREYAGKHDVDLIAIGAHGRRGLDRFLTERVAERVVRTADPTVLTLPAPRE